MILLFNKIETKKGIALLNKIGADKKWFLSFFNTKIDAVYSIDLAENDCTIQVGICIFVQYNLVTDCSFFIFPEYRRQGFARKIISDLTLKNENIKFTVSNFNTISLKLFESIEILTKSETKTKNNTCIFIKKPNHAHYN
jgi:hypothetical protein